MRIRISPARRAGFTLIELLVVIAILTLLVGLTMAGIGRVRAGQLANTTEGHVKKLQVAVNQQLTAAMDEATKSGNQYIPLLLPYADNDKDRVKSLLTYATSKRIFPMNFAEANTPVAGIPSHRAFAQIPAATAPSAQQQSAVLLYIIVHDMAARGTTVDADAALASAEMVIPGTSFKAYKDAYGSPIVFYRWYGSNIASDPRCVDLQNPPYVNPKDLATFSSVDPFDRWGKLVLWSPASGNKATTLGILNQNASIPVNYDGMNKVITVVSAGPDSTLGTPDDVYGYPLARFGARGN